jgi:serine phosphatase RsbU (regulator of sigma subunit)
MIVKRKIFFILFLLVSKLLFSQGLTNAGLPFLTYFPYDEYEANPQNWDCVQAPNGKMYFTNGDGVLEFDGNWWRLIKLPNKTVVRSIDVATDGTIYVGGYEEFGRLQENEIGQLEYKSLTPLLPKNYKYFQDVWTTHVINERVFFHTSTSVFVLKDSTIQEFRAEWDYSWASVAQEHFFTHDMYYGLKTYVNNELVKLGGTKRFDKERVFNVIDYTDSLYLIATSKGNFFICDINLDELIIEIKDSINNATTEIIKRDYYYTGINYKNQNLCLTTYYGGIFLCDMSLNPIMNLNESFGLDNNNITNIYKDKNNNIWLTMDRGITLINMDLSKTILNKHSNLKGSIKDAVIYDDPSDKIPKRIYAASIEGIFYKDLNSKSNPFDKEHYQKFDVYSNFREETWDLFKYKNRLLCATTYGTFEIKNNTLEQISWRSARSFTTIKNKPNSLIVNLENGLELIKFKNGKWASAGKIKNSKGFISLSFFDKDGFLWTESVDEGVYKITLSENMDSITNKQAYSTNKGLPSPTLNFPFKLGDEIKVTTEKGVYQYNKTSDKFITDKILNPIIGNEKPDFLMQTPDSNIWYISSVTNTLGELIYQQNSNYVKDNAHFNDIRKLAISNISYYNDTITLLSSSNGLIIYDKIKRREHQKTIHTHIKKVEIINNPNSIYTVSNKTSSDKIQTLTFKQNALRFSFAATSFVSAYKNQFSYYLEGFDKSEQWSDWSSQPVKEYNYLREGEYVLHVKSRDLHMNYGNKTTYHFEVLAPFYRTYLAYTIYFILGAALLYLLWMLNSKRLRKINLNLENKVKKRTIELNLQKKKITDSIEYALQIQKAILPSEDVIKEISEEFFIYYNPKDIVSGDFYWFSKSNDDLFFATVDCTGHGVPGGFMSMIGNTLLNELVVHDKVLQPAKILDAMHSKLRFILNQSEKDTGANTDGMEVCIIKFDKQNQLLTIASAMHSVLLMEDNEFIHIKGDPNEIGGIYRHTDDIRFTEKTVKYKKGSMLYTYSDGYMDQFGGSKNQKFSFKRFEKLLFHIKDLSMEKQKQNLETIFKDWKGSYKQIDDVTIIGFRL